ncbi:sensor histidine kinase [Streptomyces cinereoruber]|uniref:histidine kinase n=1 Tax=Streptomyces cinereoruber TaxID=67260 RepID=A0ABX6BPD6_9ACTN|nr:ATP-binding protein [Streptomyces cinereoruber]MBB4158246.1 signal transduction histidine kinase [Streptomyces cinereoruber]MBY8819220.1 sensor histidine kinase [Streptomyces cinereoruber]NIH63379.1 signal transduction histidine kinase [Streptomyces cinereoruber]QEV36036.1 sensor histidine kinase [Streptomyces cinereoruber]
MTAPLPTGERSSLSAVGLPALLAAVTAGLSVTAAVVTAPSGFRTPLAWGGGAAALLLSVAVAVTAHSSRSARLTRRRLGAAKQEVARLRREQSRSAEAFGRERAELFEEFGRERARLVEEFAQDRNRIVGEIASERAGHSRELLVERERFTTEIDRLAEENTRLTEHSQRATAARDATVTAIAGVAGRLQALFTALLADLRAMEERYTDEEVLADLLRLDHSTAQGGRLADSVAVLTGARSGRRWARPIGMESILRGAMGRISGYQRVRVHSTSEAAVAGHAAEGVMHALAELIDNAANFSPPNAEVHVYVEEVSSGIVVSVEDAGLVMSDAQLRRAEHAVSSEVGGLGGLSGTRLGLTVVGRLAHKHGLTVSFRPSARGGTSALMRVPQEILTRHPAGTPETPARTPAAAPPGVPPVPGGSPADAGRRPPHIVLSPPEALGPESSGDGPVSGGLPRRRRGQSLAAADGNRARTAAERDEQPTAPKARTARFGSFRQGVRRTPPSPDSPETAGR